jgi:hypothetical protein
MADQPCVDLSADSDEVDTDAKELAQLEAELVQVQHNAFRHAREQIRASATAPDLVD